ncbi:MAG: fasciclin domain-containing protein [Alkalinema sp. CAN_BIN05]|nr:fasciclin domain-containing protein [Alkalinema sp. CAN_BIN05]
MSIKLNVAHLLGLASILTATTIAGSTTVKAAEMAVSQTPPVTSMPKPTIASQHNSVVPITKLAHKKVSTNTLVDVASANGSFKTLTAALKAAGLVETLKGRGPFTVFAPTDAAFAKLPKGTVETLLKPENKAQLVKILTYHVVSGEVLSATIKSGKVKTVQGDTVNVLVQKSGVTINNSKVTAVDVKASNGVIHVIDTVLLPPAESASAK